jgi:hypothetical protein
MDLGVESTFSAHSAKKSANSLAHPGYTGCEELNYESQILRGGTSWRGGPTGAQILEGRGYWGSRDPGGEGLLQLRPRRKGEGLLGLRS